MIAALRARYDRFVGRGDAAVTIPAMDGALRPNQALEEARLLRTAAAPDNLAADGARLLYTSGETVFALDPSAAQDRAVTAFGSAVSALAAGPGGLIAAGLTTGGVMLRGGGADRVIDTLGSAPVRCPTALAFDGDALLIALGAADRGPALWKHDLMLHGATGSVWRVPLGAGSPVRLAAGLAWPYGLLPTEAGVVVSESWRARLLLLLPDGAVRPVLADLPGYPARLSPARDGGAWLSVFAPRSQIVEFVLREPGFRDRMIAEIDPALWVAPALIAGRSFGEPVQGGGVKMMGILKPWAPCRAYGLIVGLDASFAPVASYHSRADGTRHGVTSAIEHAGSVIAASKGGDAIVSLDRISSLSPADGKQS